MNNYIEFPKLGFKFFINPEAFHIGPFTIMWYGFIICVGFVLAAVLALRACKKYGILQDDLLDYMLFGAPIAIIGARLYFVIFSWKDYEYDLSSIFKIWEGGLAIYGGVIAAVLTIFFVSRYKKQSFINFLDFIIPYIMLGQAIGRWGNFTNQEAFGGPTTLPWGMTGNGIINQLNIMKLNGSFQGDAINTLVHPTFLYESLICFAGFTFLMIYTKHKKSNGEMIALYMIIYGAARTLIEGLRMDSLYWLDTSIRVSQVLSALLFVAGIMLFIYFRMIKKVKEVNIDETIH